MPEARYDVYAEAYVERFVPGLPGGFSVLTSGLVPDVSGAVVLDLGCGEGWMSRWLATQGATVTGIDLSTELLGRARAAPQPPGITYQLADAAERSLLAGDSFDLVIANMSLSDIEDLTGALSNVYRLLRPGGAFVWMIVHPCSPGDDVIPSAWPPDHGYASEGWWTTNGAGLRGHVGAHHRTVSTYLNAHVDVGLAIDRVAEPELEAYLPGKPAFLAVRAVRPGTSSTGA